MENDSKNTLGDRIRFALKYHPDGKKTQRWLYEHLGVSQGVVSQWCSNLQRPKKIHEVAQALKVSLDWLDGKSEEMTNKNSALQSKVVYVSEDFKDNQIDTVPILGNANGSSEALVLNFSEQIGIVGRHPKQVGMKGAFAVYAKGESMHPMYKTGKIIYVIQNKPPVKEEGCVIEMKNGESYIKEFIRQTDKEIICKQYNPEKEWKRPLGEVKAIHAIVGTG